MTPSCLKRVCEMFARNCLLDAELYTTYADETSARVERLAWDQSIPGQPILRQWNGNPAIALALLKGLHALEAQGRVVRSESLSASGTAQPLVCWRLCAAPGATT